jgi:hypothetical protein
MRPEVGDELVERDTAVGALEHALATLKSRHGPSLDAPPRSAAGGHTTVVDRIADIPARCAREPTCASL